MKVEKVAENEAFFRIHLGSGKIGEADFTFSLLTNGSGLLFEFPEGKYLVPMEEIVGDLIKELEIVREENEKC
jgi:hypothetical protein